MTALFGQSPPEPTQPLPKQPSRWPSPNPPPPTRVPFASFPARHHARRNTTTIKGGAPGCRRGLPACHLHPLAPTHCIHHVLGQVKSKLLKRLPVTWGQRGLSWRSWLLHGAPHKLPAPASVPPRPRPRCPSAIVKRPLTSLWRPRLIPGRPSTWRLPFSSGPSVSPSRPSALSCSMPPTGRCCPCRCRAWRRRPLSTPTSPSTTRGRWPTSPPPDGACTRARSAWRRSTPCPSASTCALLRPRCPSPSRSSSASGSPRARYRRAGVGKASSPAQGSGAPRLFR